MWIVDIHDYPLVCYVRWLSSIDIFKPKKHKYSSAISIVCFHLYLQLYGWLQQWVLSNNCPVIASYYFTFCFNYFINCRSNTSRAVPLKSMSSSSSEFITSYSSIALPKRSYLSSLFSKVKQKSMHNLHTFCV